MEIIKTENLTKIYGKDDTAVTAVDHLNIQFEAGVFTAIVGTSGSGKSTLMHLLGGVDNPTEGTVWIDGMDIYKLGMRSGPSSEGGRSGSSFRSII